MKRFYTTPVVFDVNGVITLTSSQLGKLGYSDPKGILDIFKEFQDAGVFQEYQIDPDDLLANPRDYGINDPDNIEEWIDYFMSLGQD